MDEKFEARFVVSLSFPLHKNRNQSITKKFPIKTLLKTIDSSVVNSGEVEYDKQNRLQRQKTQVLLNNAKWGLPLLATLHKSVNNEKVSNWNTFGNDEF